MVPERSCNTQQEAEDLLLNLNMFHEAEVAAGAQHQQQGVTGHTGEDSWLWNGGAGGETHTKKNNCDHFITSSWSKPVVPAATMRCDVSSGINKVLLLS